MQLNRVIFGVGLMITGALTFLTWDVCYTLQFCAEYVTVLDEGALGWIGRGMFFCGFWTALLNCRNKEKKEDKK